MMESDDRGRLGSGTAPTARDTAGPSQAPEPTFSVATTGKTPDPTTVAAPRSINGLLEQGRGLFRRGRLQQAIHVWTRILFLDRNNRAARAAIEQAKSVIAERQREMDALVLEAARSAAAGDRRGAQKRLARVLALDPRHAEGRGLWEKIEEQTRRGEVRSGSLALAGSPAEEEASPSQRRRVVAPSSVKTESASPLKMAAFFFSALCLFAAGAVYVHLNWDFLVSDGRPSAEPNQPTLDVPTGLPSLSELHYFNGTRLYTKGSYREALSELALVDPENPNFEEARSLILRIEGRLLRGVVLAESEDFHVRNEKGE
jgi:tetratricopeptide (TPR) repeat protein